MIVHGCTHVLEKKTASLLDNRLKPLLQELSGAIDAESQKVTISDKKSQSVTLFGPSFLLPVRKQILSSRKHLSLAKRNRCL